MTDADILDSLEPVAWERSCEVAPDDSEVIRRAQPLDDQARAQLREQAIARMQRDPAAVLAREQHIAERAGKLTRFRKRA